jgi:hypothetical protein
MTQCQIYYFREGLLEATDELICNDVVEAAKRASAKYPHLTAEIWFDGRKVGIVRPCSRDSS